MKKTKIDVNKVNELLSTSIESQQHERVEFEKFLYNLFSINNILDINDILDLNIQYINRTVRILNKIDFYGENECLLNENDYVSIMDLYRFSTIMQNFNNYKHSIKNNIVPKALTYI